MSNESGFKVTNVKKNESICYKSQETPFFKRPWGLGEIKHTIIIISISFHGWRCIMIPHADFVLTLAIIGMSKLLYICTQIKPTKLTSYLIHKWIAIIAFLRIAHSFFWQALILVSDVVSEIRKLYASIHTQELVKTNLEMLWLPKQLYRSSFSISFLRFGWRFQCNLKHNFKYHRCYYE